MSDSKTLAEAIAELNDGRFPVAVAALKRVESGEIVTPSDIALANDSEPVVQWCDQDGDWKVRCRYCMEHVFEYEAEYPHATDCAYVRAVGITGADQ